jgi:Ca-activated chloride channel family protein
MSFQWPLALVGLLVVPLLVLLYLDRERRRETFAARFANPALLPNVVDHSPGWRRHLPFAVLVVALAAMVVGVARPQATISVQREEATILLAIDVSRSMTATDVRPSRLDAARAAAGAFLRKVPDRFRVGVISFATRATVALPPTEDRDLAEAALGSLRPGEGTSLGDAIVLAAELAKRERSTDGTILPTAVLVISDGAQQGGKATPAQAIQKARAQRIPVYSVLVGTPNGTLTRILPGGFREVTRVPPNATTLQQLAKGTGGQFFTARTDTRLRDVYERLGSRLGTQRKRREITDLFAGGSAALLLVGGAVSALWFRRLP